MTTPCLMLLAALVPGADPPPDRPDGWRPNLIRLRTVLGRVPRPEANGRCTEADRKELAGYQAFGVPGDAPPLAKMPCPAEFASRWPSARAAFGRCSPEWAERLADRADGVAMLPDPEAFLKLVAGRGDPAVEFLLEQAAALAEPGPWRAFVADPDRFLPGVRPKPTPKAEPLPSPGPPAATGSALPPWWAVGSMVALLLLVVRPRWRRRRAG